METSAPAPSAVSHLNKQREEPELITGVTALCSVLPWSLTASGPLPQKDSLHTNENTVD